MTTNITMLHYFKNNLQTYTLYNEYPEDRKNQLNI